MTMTKEDKKNTKEDKKNETIDNIDGCYLSNGNITIPAGTYFVSAMQSFRKTKTGRLKKLPR